MVTPPPLVAGSGLLASCFPSRASRNWLVTSRNRNVSRISTVPVHVSMAVLAVTLQIPDVHILF